jgi:hypothetical protein
MKTGFPQAPEPIQGIPTLQSLIELLFHLCHCVQMQRSPASATMNLLYCAAPPDVCVFLTTEAYTATFAPFPPTVPDVLNYTECTDDNKHATVKVTHSINNKTWADIVTMNTAFANIFLEALSLQVRTSFLQLRFCEPNIVFADMFIFVDMFVWFVNQHRKTTAEDCKANRQRMAANWHPSKGFDTLVLRLFTGTVFAGCTNFTMAGRNIINIGLRIIKQCGMCAKEYKA